MWINRKGYSVILDFRHKTIPWDAWYAIVPTNGYRGGTTPLGGSGIKYYPLLNTTERAQAHAACVRQFFNIFLASKRQSVRNGITRPHTVVRRCSRDKFARYLWYTARYGAIRYHSFTHVDPAPRRYDATDSGGYIGRHATFFSADSVAPFRRQNVSARKGEIILCI